MSLPTQRIDPESTNPNRLIIFSPPKHGKTTLISELDKKTYQPENYFINYLKCVEN